MKRATALTVAILCSFSFSSHSAEKRLSVEWMFSDEGENATALPRFAWLGTSDLLVFDQRRPEAERTLDRLNAGTGERRAAIDRNAVLAGWKALLGEGGAPRAIAWPDAIDPSGKNVLYTISDDLFLVELSGSHVTRLTATPAFESIPRFSPDGRRVAFVRDNDLYALDLATRSEKRLTSDGSAVVLNGSLSWLYWEEVFNHETAGYWWSPDGGAIAFLRTDESAVSEILFPGVTPAVPAVIRQRYPKAGGANPLVRLGIVDVASGQTVFVDSDQAPAEYILGTVWQPDGKRLALQVTGRAQTRIDLYFVDRVTGAAAHILSESDPAWVNQHDLQFVEADGKRFTWTSERDGHTHVYLATHDGARTTPITRGDWSLRGPNGFYSEALNSVFVDPARGIAYVMAMEKSPIERHLYRVRLDGSGFERLTREDGEHRITMSPDRRFYVDSHSAHCTPPSLFVVDAESGKRTVTIGATARDLPASLGWNCPELLTIPGSDGLKLQARVTRPPDFDASKKYPVIFYVYGGPSAPIVIDSFLYSFANNAPFDQILVREGYVVVNIDPRSSTGASKTVENTVAGRVWSDVELNDLLAAVRWVKTQPWVDAARVGIWGWSGGATFTLLALTRSSEFKAGISIAPVTDWHFYDTKFTETYMKTPADNPDGYARTSLVALAKNLHGRLLLVHGTGDDNVHPQNSYAMIDALVEAGRRFDVMIYPMRKHSIDDRPARIHLYNKMLEFWNLYLKR